ncbi:zf-HC2 domain-containing protein [Cohnella pontilimi]|uniref:Anti-sigma-W factor RsiW n=1 Tax=Cohnella pontilimi TaxID=2564100 RepID=A0A4U0FF72_9BACL|nr:zf-HC2 domain-containing protein [Cohnella pontilimi]TJY43478.1 zf-HC2 domain-containing protein [Cohnella pontilimi]
MNCEEVMELMQRHIDGDLNAEETSRMLDHVGHCPDCAAMLQRLTNLSRGLEQLPRVVPPYSLVDAILPQLGDWETEAAGAEAAEEQVVTAPRARRAARKRSEWIGRLAGVGAIAAVVLLLLIGGPNFLPMGSADRSKEAGSDLNNDRITTKMAGDNGSPAASSSGANMGDRSVTTDSPVTFGASTSPEDEPSASTKKDVGTNPGDPTSPHPDRNAAASPSASGDQTVEPRASADAQEKGPHVPSTNPVTPPPTAMIMQQPPDEEVLSPDGQWRAVILEGLFQLFRTDDGTLAYESPSNGGKRSGIVWKEDSSAVTYTYVDADGNKSFRYVDVSELKEKPAP